MLKMFFATGTYASINLINGFEVQQIKKYLSYQNITCIELNVSIWVEIK